MKTPSTPGTAVISAAAARPSAVSTIGSSSGSPLSVTPSDVRAAPVLRPPAGGRRMARDQGAGLVGRLDARNDDALHAGVDDPADRVSGVGRQPREDRHPGSLGHAQQRHDVVETEVAVLEIQPDPGDGTRPGAGAVAALAAVLPAPPRARTRTGS